MVDLLVYDSKIFNKAEATAKIIKEYQTYGSVQITMNKFEGPCCVSLGLYQLLDSICDIFNFDKSKITIRTGNLEEYHPHYHIEIDKIDSLHWLRYTQHGVGNRNPIRSMLPKKLFGCLFNTPTWHRLCLLSHVSKLDNDSVRLCNPTWDIAYNRVWLDDIITECPSELSDILELIRNVKHHTVPLDKNNFNPFEIVDLYEDFFVEIVSETFVTGITFYPTEKSIRPMALRTPFILMGPVKFLSNLKNRYGFKTFSAWWDESYDLLQQYDRIHAIYKIISRLDLLSVAEKQSMFLDMQDVLNHNKIRLAELCKTRATKQ
tara:strand:+ start:1029 stop:1985 length:957 start_codon:yes stop_codon:yes gene_type:complete